MSVPGEAAAAAAELRELAAGRADLLAELAGIPEGASAGELDKPFSRQAAALCRAAWADPDAIPGPDRRGQAAPGPRRPAAVLRRPAPTP